MTLGDRIGEDWVQAQGLGVNSSGGLCPSIWARLQPRPCNRGQLECLGRILASTQDFMTLAHPAAVIGTARADGLGRL
jgi:hypothetical protein